MPNVHIQIQPPVKDDCRFPFMNFLLVMLSFFLMNTAVLA